MMFHHRRMRLACGFSAFLVLLMLLAIQVINPSVPSAHAATNQFRGVNWADTRDNFVNGPIIPSGLSTSDSYATTYTKSTAILKGFQTNLGANTVRFGINESTVSSSWWGSYIAAFDAASALGMNVMIAPWAAPGTSGFVTNTTTFFNMWNVVINKYNSNNRIYFEIYNEPNGYSATTWTNFAASFLAHYPNVARGRIVVAGVGNDGDLGPVGADSRLNGTLLSLHLYAAFGITHTTEAAWVTELNNHLAGYGSRAVITEFGVPMTTGVNYDGPRDGDNNISYLYAMTDTAHSQGIGVIYWPGLRNGDVWSMESLSGSGTNLSLRNNNSSGVDRLKYAYNLTSGGPTPTPGGLTPTPTSGGSGSYYKLINRNSGKVLDVTGASTANGTQIDQWTDTGATNQQWSLVTSGGYTKLVNRNSGKDLDVTGASTANGASVIQWTDDGGTNQQWSLVTSGGYTKLVNRNSGKDLDVSGASASNGAVVVQWTDNGGANQQWSLVQVS